MLPGGIEDVNGDCIFDAVIVESFPPRGPFGQM